MRLSKNSYKRAKPLELSIIQAERGRLSTTTSSILLLRGEQLSLLSYSSSQGPDTAHYLESSDEEDGEMLPSKHDFLRLCAHRCGVALSPLSVFDLMLKMQVESSVGGLKSDLLGWLFTQFKEGASTLLGDKGDGSVAVSECLEWLQASHDPSGALSDLVQEISLFDTNDFVVLTHSSTAAGYTSLSTISESLARYSVVNVPMVCIFYLIFMLRRLTQTVTCCSLPQGFVIIYHYRACSSL